MDIPQKGGEEEITFKDLILKLSEYWYELKKHILLVILIAFPILGFYIYSAIFTPVLYKAELTFMINHDDGASTIGGVLGQFGLGGAKGKNNAATMIELAKSRAIIGELLFEKITVNEQKDFLANHLIREYDYHKHWDGDKVNFLFDHKDLDTFSIVENAVLKILFKKIIDIKGGLVEMFFDKKTGIIQCVVKSTNEDLSFFICQKMYDILSRYYIDKSTDKQLFTYDIMSEKVDSIYKVIKDKEYRLANFNDSKRGLYSTKSQLEKKRLQRDLQVLNASYVTGLKNLEVADFTLKSVTPSIQIIDQPLKPLDTIEQKILRNIVIGSLLGLFIGSVVVLLRLIYFDLMDEK